MNNRPAPQFNGKQLLRLIRVVRREQKHAPSKDQRRRVNYVLAEYRGDADNEIYRKAFRSYGSPVVPDAGTHGQLNAMAEQWGMGVQS